VNKKTRHQWGDNIRKSHRWQRADYPEYVKNPPNPLRSNQSDVCSSQKVPRDTAAKKQALKTLAINQENAN
jgi:hypothetical protein